MKMSISGLSRPSPPIHNLKIDTSLEKDGAIAEIDAWLREIKPRPDRLIEVHRLEVETRNTITIGGLEELADLGVDLESVSGAPSAPTGASLQDIPALPAGPVNKS